MSRAAQIGLLVGCLANANMARAQLGGGTWQNLTSMPVARQELATAVLNGKIYVIAGYDGQRLSTNTVQVYNPATNTWAMAQSLPIFNNHDGAATAAGKLYTLGGVSTRVFVYNPTNNIWSDVAPMHFQHAGTPAVGVIGDKIYVAGGVQAGQSIKQLEVYDPNANTWTPLAPMNAARNHIAGGVINGKFYVAGGRNSSNTALTILEVYDPQSNTWATRAPMLTGRSGIAAATVNDELWVFGGETLTLGGGGQVHREVEVYNPISNTWRSVGNMPVPRHGIWASVIGNRIYLPGGGAVPDLGPTNHNDVFIVAYPGTFSNISSRARVETGANVAIAGFIVQGNSSKRIMVRALGPALSIPGTLINPSLQLYDVSGHLVAANDNWATASNKQEIIDSALAPPQQSEAAILTRVLPGNYTAIVSGVNATSGIVLIEVYDLEAGSDSRLVNVSTRAVVKTGDNVLIGGVIVGGNTPLHLIVRALGPSLPVPGQLPNPILAVFNANGQQIAANDNWRSTQQAEIMATGFQPPSDLESAIVGTFVPGNYTAIVRGAGGTVGVGLVEAYALP